MTTWVSLHRWIAAAVVAAAILGVWVGYRALTSRAERFEQAAQRAEAVNGVLTQRANEANARADSAIAVAKLARSRVDTLKQRVLVVDSVSRPDSTCGPSIAARNEVIVEQDSVILAQNVAIGQLQQANVLLRQAKDSLANALALRPKRFSRFIGPNISLGAGIGLDPIATLQGKPLALRLTAGVTINLGGIHL